MDQQIYVDQQIGANHRGFREAMLQFAAEGDEISARVDADALDLELWS